MKPLRLEEILAAVGGKFAAAGCDCNRQNPVQAICIDSRKIQPGELFVAINGERFDAHAFVGQVMDAGAAGAIIASSADIGAEIIERHGQRLIVVENTVVAMGLLASHHRELVKAKVIAVTGSNGKTTTKRMIQHILAKHFQGSCSPKSFNNNIGLPLTLLAVGERDDYVICEVGSNAPGEIAELSAIARPDVAAIVSVGETHLEKLISIEGVAVEKASMLNFVRPSGVAIVHADSEPLAAQLGDRSCRLIRFGQDAKADICLSDYTGTSEGSTFYAGGVAVRLPLAGRHNASNAVAAIAAAMQMGLSFGQAAADLADFGGVEMRLESVQAGPILIINDAYNANPSSMLAGADVLAEQTGTRRVMIAGDMRELGEASKEMHERVGRQIAQRRLDLLIGVGAMGRYIASSASQAGMCTEAFDSVDAAASGLLAILRPGDVVLIKGSRGMAMERLIEPLRKFFDPSADDKGFKN